MSISQIERRFDPKDFLSQNSDFVESLVQQRHFGENRGEEGIIYYTGEGLCTQRGMTALAQVRSSLQNNPYLARNPINGKLVLPRGEFPIIERGEKICATQDVFEITVTYTREVANLQVVRERLQKDLEPLEGIADYGITGPPYMRAAGVNAMTGSLLTTAGVAVVLIFLVLIVTFRSLWLAILTLLPMGIVVLFTFALMAQIGFALNFITATMGAVSFGVGINYPIYIVQRFRQERRQGRGRETAIAQTISHSGQAVCAAALTSMMGFAVLSAAPMPMFFTYGVLGVAMIGFSFIVAIFVLPLLLAHSPQV